MGRHVAVLGFIHAIFGVLGVLAGVGILVFGLGGGLAAWLGGGEDGAAAGGLFALLGSGLGIVVIVSSGLGVLTGIGILGRRSWGRVLGVIASVLNLANFPWLTLLGIYGLWVLLSTEGAAEFGKTR